MKTLKDFNQFLTNINNVPEEEIEKISHKWIEEENNSQDEILSKNHIDSLLGVNTSKSIRAMTAREIIGISQGDMYISMCLDCEADDESGRSIKISIIGDMNDICIPESDFGNIDIIIEALRIAKKKLGL
jgi:hypothetical protein